MKNLTIAISGALFIVWMQRQGRWSLFLKAMAGEAKIVGTNQGTPSSTSTASVGGTGSLVGEGGTPGRTGTGQQPAGPG